MHRCIVVIRLGNTFLKNAVCVSTEDNTVGQYSYTVEFNIPVLHVLTLMEDMQVISQQKKHVADLQLKYS